VRSRNVRGIDIGGEWPADPLDLLRPETYAMIRKNEQANERLLETLLAA
jgi:hypothetical protein